MVFIARCFQKPFRMYKHCVVQGWEAKIVEDLTPTPALAAVRCPQSRRPAGPETPGPRRKGAAPERRAWLPGCDCWMLRVQSSPPCRRQTNLQAQAPSHAQVLHSIRGICSPLLKKKPQARLVNNLTYSSQQIGLITISQSVRHVSCFNNES